MKSLKFSVGDRVRVSQKHDWGKNALGTISYPPGVVVNLEADNDPWEGHHRLVKGLDGIIEFYYVSFDISQYDEDGHGPYKGCEIEADMLEKI